MSITVRAPNGSTVEFPDGTDTETITRVMTQFGGTQSGPSMSLAERGEDLAKSAGSGLVQGVVNLAGLPGAVREGLTSAAGWAGEKLGVKDFGDMVRRSVNANPIAAQFGTPDEIGERVAEAYGDTRYKPKTTLGDYAKTTAEFAPGAALPGSAAMRIIGGVLAPGVGSETMGQVFRGKPEEGIMRAVGGFGGGLAGSGAVAARAATRGYVPGVSNAAGRTLQKHMGPDAERKLAELGDQAFLFEGSPQSMSIAQGIASRPSPGMDVIEGAVRGRHEGGNARIRGDMDQHLGPAVSPVRIEENLQAQRDQLQPLYQQVSQHNNPVDLRPIYDQIRMQIPEEAGPAQAALNRIRDWIAPEGPAGRTVRSNPREVLNVRQAMDDEIQRLGETPKAQRIVQHYRRMLDDALATNNPDIKTLDNTYSGLMRQSERLRDARGIMGQGPEAMRPEDLIAMRQGMPGPERVMQRAGVRAELDRVIGTEANDINALRKAVRGEGDWNRVKLAEVFGGREADRILNSIDREAAFQESHRRLFQNSMTAQRLAGQKEVALNTEQQSMRNATIPGVVMEYGVQKPFNWVRDVLRASNRNATDEELARLFTRQGASRDDLLRAIRQGQRRRDAAIPRDNAQITRDALIRAVFGSEVGALH